MCVLIVPCKILKWAAIASLPKSNMWEHAWRCTGKRFCYRYRLYQSIACRESWHNTATTMTTFSQKLPGGYALRELFRYTNQSNPQASLLLLRQWFTRSTKQQTAHDISGARDAETCHVHWNSWGYRSYPSNRPRQHLSSKCALQILGGTDGFRLPRRVDKMWGNPLVR